MQAKISHLVSLCKLKLAELRVTEIEIKASIKYVYDVCIDVSDFVYACVYICALCVLYLCVCMYTIMYACVC